MEANYEHSPSIKGDEFISKNGLLAIAIFVVIKKPHVTNLVRRFTFFY